MLMTNTLKFSLFSFFLSFNWISFKAQSQSLKFELEIAKPSSGEILKKGNWMISVKDKNGLIILQEVVPFKNRKQLCELQVPEFGIYSASFYLDLNLNKTLDKGFFGQPKEPYGFSNNVRNYLKQPSIESQQFKFNNNDTTYKIVLDYHFIGI